MDDNTFQNTEVAGILLGLETKKYYFLDETEDVNGPFDTSDEARTARDKYSEFVLGPPAPGYGPGTTTGRIDCSKPNLSNAPRPLKEK